MKRRISSAVFVASIAAATFAFAQSGPATPGTPPPGPQNPPTTSQSQPPARGGDNTADHVTLTGCLQPARSDATSANQSSPGAANETSTSQRLILKNAMTPEEASAKTTTASGAPEGKTYPLVANVSALQPYIGKQVELTGTIEGQAPAERLRVESGKAYNSTCE